MMASTHVPSILLASAQMAVAGKYRAAEALLDALADDEATADVVALRAKIFAQQGQYDDAIALWQEILTTDPTNLEARQGVERAKLMATRRGSRLFLGATLRHGVLAFVVLGLIIFIAFVAGRATGMSKNDPVNSLLVTQEGQFQFNREAISAIDDLTTRLHSHTAAEIKALESHVASFEKNLLHERALLDQKLASGNSSTEQRLAELDQAADVRQQELATAVHQLAESQSHQQTAIANLHAALAAASKQVAAIEGKLNRLDTGSEVLGELSHIQQAVQTAQKTLADNIVKIGEVQSRQQAEITALKSTLAGSTNVRQKDSFELVLGGDRVYDHVHTI